MMRYTRDTVLLLALCASFAGCAGDTKGSEDTAAAMSAARSDRAATAGALDACALVQKAEVDAAFAPRVFGNGEKGASDMAGTDRLAAVSTCTFTSTGPSARELMTVSIFVRRAPSDAMGVSLATAKEGAVKLNAPPPSTCQGWVIPPTGSISAAARSPTSNSTSSRVSGSGSSSRRRRGDWRPTPRSRASRRWPRRRSGGSDPQRREVGAPERRADVRE